MSTTAPLHTNGVPPTGTVLLADGRYEDLSQFTPDDLLGLQWEQEQAFARQILGAPKGSETRAKATRLAYETVSQIFMAQYGLSTDQLLLGIHPRYVRFVLELLARHQQCGIEPRFFEIGYGTGTLLKGVSDAGFPVFGIEVSASMHAQACRLLGSAHEAHLHLGEFLRYEFPTIEGQCSLVYWNDVFEHIPPDEIRDYLRRIHQMLVPGGQLVTITPTWHMRPWDVTRAFSPPRTESAGLHLKEYTLREVSHLLWECGFASVSTPLVILPSRVVLLGTGLAGLKRCVEPALEWLPFSLTRLLCRGFAFSMTVATKAS